jgi:hypothetical protein
MNHDPIIAAVIESYFDGVHRGDLALLRTVFHPSAILVGEVRGQTSFRTLDAYLTVVATRQSPAVLGHPLRAALLSIDRQGAMATARARFPLLGFDYLDLLSLGLIDGRWRIVAKLYTHLEPPV